MIPDPDQGFPCPISVLPPLDQLRAQVKRHQPPHLHFPAPKAGDFNRMAGWFRQILRKPKKRHMQSESSTRDVSELPSQSSSLPPRQDSASAPTPKPADTDSRSSGSRWSKTYDVCVCHSEEDLIPAQELVSYLEDEPDGLRCFMHLRDAAPGGAIVSELCQALGSSHCCVLFITPHFLQDPWCKYQMLQALSEAPGSEGHTIPLVTGLARSNYPPELRFMYYVDGNGPDNGFPKVKNTVWRCKRGGGGGGTQKAFDLPEKLLWFLLDRDGDFLGKGPGRAPKGEGQRYRREGEECNITLSLGTDLGTEKGSDSDQLGERDLICKETESHDSPRSFPDLQKFS
uniref:TIR domain containing adaptor protein n=1 Tax=Monodelphis domestica TaxID=13616 RepID=F6Y4P9_MONDO